MEEELTHGEGAKGEQVAVSNIISVTGQEPPRDVSYSHRLQTQDEKLAQQIVEEPAREGVIDLPGAVNEHFSEAEMSP